MFSKLYGKGQGISQSKIISGGCYGLLFSRTMVLILCFWRCAIIRRAVASGSILEPAIFIGTGIVCSIVCRHGSPLLFRLWLLLLARILFWPVFGLLFLPGFCAGARQIPGSSRGFQLFLFPFPPLLQTSLFSRYKTARKV